MARVQVSGTSPQVALQPQAAPVETFKQAEAPQASPAEMRAKMLEGVFANTVTPALKQMTDKQQREDLEFAKDELAIAASADYIGFKNSIEPELYGLNPDETTAHIQKKFGERYEGMDNPFLASALNNLNMNFVTSAANTARVAGIKAGQEQFAAAISTNVNDLLAKMQKGELTQEQFNSELDVIFTASRRGKGDPSVRKLEGSEVNKVFALVGADSDSDYMLEYFKAKGLDKTNTPDYEVPLNQMRKQSSDRLSYGATFKMKVQADELVRTGRVKELQRLIANEWMPVLSKLGIKPDFLAEKLDAAKAKATSLNDTNLKNQALNKAVIDAIENNGVIGDPTYTDSKGSQVLNEAEVRRRLLETARSNPAVQEDVLTHYPDPVIKRPILAGAAALDDIMDPEKSSAAVQSVTAGLEAYRKLKAMGNQEILTTQMSASHIDMYEAMDMAAQDGVSAKDIASNLSALKQGRGKKATSEQLESMTDSIVGEFDPDGILWWEDPIINRDYISQRLGQLYNLHRATATSDEEAQTRALEVFERSHTLSQQNDVAVLLNMNTLSGLNDLSGNTTSQVPSASSQIDRINDAAEMVLYRIREEYPDVAQDSQIFITQSISDPKKFEIRTTNGGVVFSTGTYTAKQIGTLSREWANHKRTKPRSRMEERERLRQQNLEDVAP